MSHRADCDRSRHPDRQGYPLKRGSGPVTIGVHLNYLCSNHRLVIPDMRNGLVINFLTGEFG